eukprot:m.1059090 g.1059090  ORF g.1059090 m.1059090 type:complete len:400 (-) comp24208_c0_seq28:740-1939(-)
MVSSAKFSDTTTMNVFQTYLCLPLFLAMVSSSPDQESYNTWLRHLSHFSDADKVQSRSISGGLSNRNFQIFESDPENAPRTFYIMRVPGDLTLAPEHNYSRIHLINRSMEARCAAAAGESGVAPTLIEYNSTSGVMLTQWLEGDVLNGDTVIGELGAIGGILRQFHDKVAIGIQSSSIPLYTPYYRIANYFELADEMKVDFPPALEIQLREARLQARQLDNDLAAIFNPRDAVALHCDLIPGNFIRTPAVSDDVGGGTKSRLWLFDFEYCHFGDRVWDLANVIVFNGLNPEQAQVFLAGYNVDPADKRYELLTAKLEVMQWMYGVMEGMWGVIQHQVSDLPFEAGWAEGVSSFHEYGVQHLERTMRKLSDPVLAGYMQRIREAAVAAISPPHEHVSDEL